MSGDDPRSLGDSLDGLLRSMHGTDRRQIGGVFGTWDEAVGPAVAAHVRPIRVDRRVLTVDVDDPTWATQVKLLHDDLLARVVAASGADLERIEVRVGRIARGH